MATQSTKTYLQIVNDAIDEAGAELASFAADGSDWNTQSDPMMNRFKKWTNKAWRDLQVEANDWHWLDETAVVNINPGIMFYGEAPLPQGLANITIYDVDGTVKVSDLLSSRVVDLTGIITSSKAIGYSDISYSDYSFDNQHVLDFGLKSGGEYIDPLSYKLGIFPLRFVAANFSNGAPYQIPTTVPAGHTQVFGTIPDGAILSSVDFTYYNTDDSGSFPPAWEASAVTYSNSLTCSAIINRKTASDGSTFYMLDFSNSTESDITAINQIFPTIMGAIRNPLFGNSGLVRFNYTYSGPGGIVTSSAEGLFYRYTKMTGASNTNDPCVDASVMVVPELIQLSLDGTTAFVNHIYPPTSTEFDSANFRFGSVGSNFNTTLHGHVTMENSEYLLSDSNAFIVLQEKFDFSNAMPGSLLVATAFGIGCQTQNSFTYNAQYTQVIPTPISDRLFLSFLTEVDPAASSVVNSTVALQKSFVHSWKSYNWNEENDVDDFVESIRQTNNATYRIISHDDPAVAREAPLQFVPWDTFQNKYDFASSPPGIPRIISEDNTGRFRLYPAPDRPYTIMFDYIREPQDLVEYTDIPRGLPKAYEDMVMWLTVRAYGEYDEQPSVVARANKRYKDLLLTLQQEYRPVFHFKPRRLY